MIQKKKLYDLFWHTNTILLTGKTFFQCKKVIQGLRKLIQTIMFKGRVQIIIKYDMSL